jgi:SAM-dependent methyltransferase
MKRWLYSIYCVLKRWIAPDVVSSQDAYREFLLRHLAKHPRWLDLGCGHQFLPDWAWTPDEKLLSSLPRIVGVDADLPSLKQHKFLRGRILSDIHSLPFGNGSFDLVTANMVMEHVEEPGRVLAEVRRVLAPGGLFLFHTPNGASPLIQLARRTPARLKIRLIGFFEDRSEEDIYPTVYRINTPRRVAELAAKANLRVVSCELLISEAVTQVLGPLAVFELLYIRMTQWKRLAMLRPDMIAVLRAPSG